MLHTPIQQRRIGFVRTKINKGVLLLHRTMSRARFKSIKYTLVRATMYAVIYFLDVRLRSNQRIRVHSINSIKSKKKKTVYNPNGKFHSYKNNKRTDQTVSGGPLATGLTTSGDQTVRVIIGAHSKA